MSSKLVFIGGPPGVGKTTVAKELFSTLDDSVWLDGDDLWRMHPFVVTEATKQMVERNIEFVLRSFLDTGFSYVLLTWVLHYTRIVERLLAGLGGFDFEFLHFTLKCDETTLTERLASDRNRATEVELAFRRLHQCSRVPSVKVDTVGKRPAEIAEELMYLIRKRGQAPSSGERR